jgi:acetylornithine deacetylase/succinyl-diaminopimelate desuccinylase-like protein
MNSKLCFLILYYFSCFLSSPIAGLPFRTRGSSSTQQDSEDGEDLTGKVADAVFDGAEVPEIHISKSVPGSRRNAVVESFFEEEKEFSNDLKEDIHKRATGIYDFLVYTRRALHRHPELMYNEKETSAYVQNVLRELDIPFTTGWAVNTVPDVIPGPGGYGVVADIGTGGPPCVLLRADMDALPILERTEGIDEFKSIKDGKMHACGHDGHTTMLLGAASLLKEMEESINGTVRLMFQPAEEGGAGGKRMREEGILTMKPEVQQAFGMHVWPT